MVVQPDAILSKCLHLWLKKFLGGGESISLFLIRTVTPILWVVIQFLVDYTTDKLITDKKKVFRPTETEVKYYVYHLLMSWQLCLNQLQKTH